MKILVYNQDCLDGLRKLKSKSVRLIVADPPYFLGMTHNGSKGSFVDLAICKPFFTAFFKEVERVLTDDGEIYFFTCWRGYAFYFPVMDEILKVKNLLVWDKGFGRVNKNFAFSHELILWASKTTKHVQHCESNIFKFKGFSSLAERKVHDTQKPIELIKKIISISSNEGETVVDPFMGSGTTAKACKELNRNCIGFELDLKNFEILKNRLGVPSEEVVEINF